MTAPQAEPKKSSCLALGGVGCLIVIILLVVGGGIVWVKFGPQIQEKMAEFQKDPERAAAMLILNVNPDIEIVKIDEEKRLVTFKVKSSEEVITATFAALGKSRMTYINGKTEIQGLDRVPTENGMEPAPPESVPTPKAP